jgi:S1-C subfamily serine protease
LVVNVAGEPLGIATSALSRIAGLAIPTTTIDRVVDEIVARGRVSHGYLGVGLQPVELPDHQRGVIVLSLQPDGPASRGGVLIGDILVSLGGHRTPDVDDLQLALEGYNVSETVEATVLRGGSSHTLAITVGERPRRS